VKEQVGHHPRLLAPNMLGRPSSDQTEYFPAEATLVRKKTKRRNKALKP
jgi:hypothetical protein